MIAPLNIVYGIRAGLAGTSSQRRTCGAGLLHVRLLPSLYVSHDYGYDQSDAGDGGEQKKIMAKPG